MANWCQGHVKGAIVLHRKANLGPVCLVHTAPPLLAQGTAL